MFSRFRTAAALAVLVASAAVVGFPAGAADSPIAATTTDRTAGPMIAHMVFFTLKTDSPAARAKLVAACKKYLTGHDGTVYFSAGTRVAELDRAVNDQTFDVALHVVFQDKAAHDAYQVAPRHLEFIAENKADWSGVRVFDSYVTD